MEIQIRAAEDRDLGDIARIECDASHDAAMAPYADAVLQSLLPHTDVLVVDGAVAGFCTHHALNKSILSKMNRLGLAFATQRPTGRRVAVCHITNIAVTQRLRRRGLGTRLVRAALAKHPSHRYVRFAHAATRRHCIETALRSWGYDACDGVVEEGRYTNGERSWRYVFARPRSTAGT